MNGPAGGGVVSGEGPVLFGVGLGPGDPELVTAKALRVLREAPVILCPGRLSRELLERVSRLPGSGLRLEEKEVRVLGFPMTRNRARLEEAHRELAREVAAVLSPGGRAAFACQGDPGLYSTFFRFLPALRRVLPGLRFETVPGVPSFSAASSLLKTPLVQEGEALWLGPCPPPGRLLPEAERLLEASRTLVFLKARAMDSRQLLLLQRAGLWWGWVRRAGLPGEEVRRAEEGGDRPRVPERLPEDYLSLLVVRREGGEE